MQAVLRPEVVATAKKKGFTELTGIQLKAIPAIAVGWDVLVIAPTGFGKSETAFLPILSKLVEAKEGGNANGIQAIYITPLRALNRDMLERLSFLVQGTWNNVGRAPRRHALFRAPQATRQPSSVDDNHSRDAWKHACCAQA